MFWTMKNKILIIYDSMKTLLMLVDIQTQNLSAAFSLFRALRWSQ